MIDEADEFVTGPQNKGKRPQGDSSPMQGGGGPKRRRCMSPLLRLGRAYTPPVTPPASPRPSAGESHPHIQRPLTPKATFAMQFVLGSELELSLQFQVFNTDHAYFSHW